MPEIPQPILSANGRATDVMGSGVPGLDSVMAGGYPRNHLFLVEGDPGTGKTTLALQFLLEGVRQGERGLYITLSETGAELAGVAASHGWSLEGIELFELMPDEEALKPDAQYTVFHPSEVELTSTTQAIFEAVERTKPVRVVVDSLSEMRLLARDSLRYRRQILGFKHFFTHQNATVLLLDDMTAEDRDSQLRSLAHGVLLLEQLALEYGAERRKLRVVKMRGTRFRGGGIMITPSAPGDSRYFRGSSRRSTTDLSNGPAWPADFGRWMNCSVVDSTGEPAHFSWARRVRGRPS
jgi:circadian clock protein KaiC